MLGTTLERLFRTPAQIAVLRVLWKAPAALTGRQVQQLAGLHNLTVMQCLRDLEGLGLVQRRSAGRAHLYSLKRTHQAVREILEPVLRGEESAVQHFMRDLAAVLRSHCLSAVLYGSTGGASNTQPGDLDLLIVVEDDSAAVARFTATTLPKAEKLIRDRWSLMLEANIKTRRELARDWNTSLLKQIRRDGQLVAGRRLEEVHLAPKPKNSLRLSRPGR